MGWFSKIPKALTPPQQNQLASPYAQAQVTASSNPIQWQGAAGVTHVGTWHTSTTASYPGVYTTQAGYWVSPQEMEEMKKRLNILQKRIEWLEAQPILKDNPPPLGLME